MADFYQIKHPVYDVINDFVVYEYKGNYYGAHSSQIGRWSLVSFGQVDKFDMASYNNLPPIDKARVAKIYFQYIKVPSIKKRTEELEKWSKRFELIINYDPDTSVKELAEYCLNKLKDPSDENIKYIVKLLARTKKLDKCYSPKNGFHTNHLTKLKKLGIIT